MSNVGSLLSEFRRARYWSQMDLSNLADISTRHLSFMENGRSQPSREMLIRLADVMDLPLRDRNLLLSAGGYAMTYSHQNLDAEEMRPVRDALDLMLDNHEPYPALVMDGNWNILMANNAQQKMLAQMGPADSGTSDGPLNLLEVMFAENGFRQAILNWEELAGFSLRRLKKQVAAYDHAPHRELLQRLLAMNPPPDWDKPPPTVEGPMVSARVDAGGQTLTIFSTLTQFGSALDVGLEELIIESYFPADEATASFFQQLAEA